MNCTPFNDYDAEGYRISRNGSRSSRIEDSAILYNLRFRWRYELAQFSDTTIIEEYIEFSGTDWFGDNDARFLEWMESVDAK